MVRKSFALLRERPAWRSDESLKSKKKGREHGNRYGNPHRHPDIQAYRLCDGARPAETTGGVILVHGWSLECHCIHDGANPLTKPETAKLQRFMVK